MSTPRIPHLATSRKSAVRARGREDIGNGAEQSKDTIVKNTDQDAATSRLSAVDAGYLIDAFAPLLTPDEVQRKLPLMNRGTYVRTKGLDRIVEAFIASSVGPCQIISLGAGSDTRYFRLKQAHRDLDLIYHEIDFEANIRTKIDRLKLASGTIENLTGVKLQIADDRVQCTDYLLHAKDLRTLNSVEKLDGVKDIPTLILSECCLIYLSPDEAQSVLDFFVNSITAPMAIAIYEPIRPGDSFGRTMVKNLVARGIHLGTFEKYAELDQQRQRLQSYGFTSKSADTEFIWRDWVDEREKERIDKLEWMDEVEEFVLLAKHYCICWGWRGFGNENQLQMLSAQ